MKNNIIFKSIVTKYHGPTNRRGSRVSATTQGAGKGHNTRIYLDWADNLNSDDNHKAAALALFNRMDWGKIKNTPRLVFGATDTGLVAVLVQD